MNIIKLKYYNSSLQIGFNSIRDGVYDCKNKVWLSARVHKGRLVYGNNRIPYTRIKKGIDESNKKVIVCPFWLLLINKFYNMKKYAKLNDGYFYNNIKKIE